MIRTPAAAAISSTKPGTIAIVPPTFAPNPGHPAATTVNTVIAAITSSARRRAPLPPRRSAAPPSQAARSRPEAA